MATLTEDATREALRRLPRELHPLLAWLVTGKPPEPSTLNGAA